MWAQMMPGNWTHVGLEWHEAMELSAGTVRKVYAYQDWPPLVGACPTVGWAVQGQPKYPAGLAPEELFVVEGILEGMIEVGRAPIEEDSLGNSQGQSDLSQMWLRSLVSQAQWRLWGMGAS